MSPSCIDVIADTFPITFEMNLVKLEYREFAIDGGIDPSIETDAVNLWISIRNMKSPMGEFMYQTLATLALQLISIPVSNAGNEQVLSVFAGLRLEYRSSLTTETVSALIGCHFNITLSCCEPTEFEEALLSKAKTCTTELNLKHHKHTLLLLLLTGTIFSYFCMSSITSVLILAILIAIVLF